MAFYVGQKVVCIHEPRASQIAKWPGSHWPHKGGVYTIRAINVWPTETLLRLAELDNSHFTISRIEPGFDASHFRPVVERKTDISIFTKMLINTRIPARVDD